MLRANYTMHELSERSVGLAFEQCQDDEEEELFCFPALAQPSTLD